MFVAIAEDHTLVRDNLCRLIKSSCEFSFCVAATNGYELLKQFQKIKHLPDVAIIDVHMPVMDGVMVTHFISTFFPQIKVLAFSNYNNPKTIESMLHAGAKGYLLKENLDQLGVALKCLKAGETFFDRDLGHFEIIPTSGSIDNGYDKLNFSEKEKQFLQLVVADISFEKIADLMHVATSTLDNYQKNIKQKTGIGSRSAMVVFALQFGFAKIAMLPEILNLFDGI